MGTPVDGTRGRHGALRRMTGFEKCHKLDTTVSRSRVGRGVIGVIEDRGRFLMVRRALALTSGGCWCFPGGHLERGETSRAALVRELSEELAIRVEPQDRLGAVRVAGERRYILAVWTVHRIKGTLQPNPAEIADYRWVTLREIADVAPGLASNRLVVELLTRRSGAKSPSPAPTALRAQP